MKDFLTTTKNKIIVSCQAVDDEPLNDTHAITLMAKAVIEGGASILRLSQYDHIKSIKKHFPSIPCIGLIKQKYDGSNVYITATRKEVDQLLELKVDCIALDATTRKRPNETLAELVQYIRSKDPNVLIMSDCSSEEDIMYSNQLGVDLIGTTLRGYTEDTKGKTNLENNYEFIKWAVKNSKIPIIAEGGIWEPYQVKEILKLGVHAVVVGSAITRPKDITKRFMEAISD